MIGIFTFSAGPCSSQSIWFAPADNLPRQGRIYVSDFMEMFERDARWQEAASRVNVFVIGEQFADRGPPEELRKIFQFLRERKISLALGLGVLPGIGCGYGIEGMISPGNATRISQRIRGLGGDVAYLVMDEPLYYGHYYDKSTVACRYAIRDVARGVAASIKEIRAIFPRIQVGDAEPLSALPASSWSNDLKEWLREYEEASARPLDFFQVELLWHQSWDQQVRDFQEILSKRAVKFGLMINANEPQLSDGSWIKEAEGNISAMESVLKERPDQLIFISWMIYPSHVLPETSPEALSYLINWYFRRR